MKTSHFIIGSLAWIGTGVVVMGVAASRGIAGKPTFKGFEKLGPGLSIPAGVIAWPYVLAQFREG